jgi:hypothetical protein
MSGGNVDNGADQLYQGHGYFSTISESGIVVFLRYFPALLRTRVLS